MAGAGYRQFTPGQILTAQQVQDFLQDQSVMVFDSSAARSSALGTFVAEGMISYLRDSDAVQTYSGSSWVNVNDNTNAILRSQFTAAGQMIFSSGSATPVTLAAGQVGQYLQSNGTSVQWATVATGGASVWFNYVPNANFQDRFFYPLGTGYYWLQAFDKNSGAGPTGDIIAYNTNMSAIATATMGTGINGESLARLSLSGTATYLTINLSDESMVLLTNAGSAQPVDATGQPTTVTSSGTVVLTRTSTVYLIGAGGAGGGKSNTSYESRGGGGSGYLTTLNSVPAGTYTVTVGAGAAGVPNSNTGATGGATIFGNLGTALGGQGGQPGGLGGNGGSGGGSGRNAVPNVAGIGTSGGVNGANGGASGDGTTAGTGSGVQLPWFLRVQSFVPANSGDSAAPGGVFYGGGGGGNFGNSNSPAGGNSGSYGGGGGGAGGVRGNAATGSTASGGSSFQGVIYITG